MVNPKKQNVFVKRLKHPAKNKYVFSPTHGWAHTECSHRRSQGSGQGGQGCPSWHRRRHLCPHGRDRPHSCTPIDENGGRRGRLWIQTRQRPPSTSWLGRGGTFRSNGSRRLLSGLSKRRVPHKNKHIYINGHKYKDLFYIDVNTKRSLYSRLEW